LIVIKSYNNSIVHVFDNNGEEKLILGLGIGFNKIEGDIIDESLIQKVFTPESVGDIKTFIEGVYSLPEEDIMLTKEIISMAEYELEDFIPNDRLFLILTDHINYAISREKESIHFRNPLLRDIKYLYPVEFQFGIKAIELINKKRNINLPIDEAGFIAIHIINMTSGLGEIGNTIQIVEVSHSIFSIIKYYFQVELNEKSYSFERFTIHLKYFILRQLNNEENSEFDLNLYQMAKENYGEFFQCALKIKGLLNAQYKWEVSKEEIFYLTIHINRLIHENGV